MFMMRPSADPIQAIRFALTGAPQPSVTDTLPVGEVARRALLAVLGGPERLPSPPTVSGHTHDGPLREQHRHPFYLPADENADGLIDHLTLFFPEPLPADDAARIWQGMTRLWRDADHEWQLLALGAWSPGAMQADGGPWAPATVWESVTPLVLHRHPKQHKDGRPKLNELGEQVDGPEELARREWAQRNGPGAPAIVSVERLSWLTVADGGTVGWLQFERRREGGGPASGFPFGLRLTFEAPVAGPVSLGYGCHFGLGQFRSVRTN